MRNKIKTTILTRAEHHLSVRHRLNRRRLNFSLIDKVVIVTGPLVPIAVFIQAYDVWIGGKVAGLSIATWLVFLLTSATMAMYAIYHKSTPLMLNYVPLVVANAMVVAGIMVLG